MDESCHPEVTNPSRPDAERVPDRAPAAAPGSDRARAGDRARSGDPARAGDPARSADPAPAPDPDKVLADCDMEFVRAGGPGGQHRNKRETGVRLTHRPTGIVIMATERRSQVANRRLALERMLERLEKLARRRKPRRKTRKSRAVRGRELEAKRLQSEKKAARRPRATPE